MVPPVQINPAMECASCGERLDQHGIKNPCPRFVPSPSFAGPSHAAQQKSLREQIEAAYANTLTKVQRSWTSNKIDWDPAGDGFPSLAESVIGVPQGAPPAAAMEAEIARQVAQMKAQIERVFNENLARMSEQFRAQNAKIEALEKANQRINLDASRLRIPEKIDYTQWYSEEEDGLEVGYNGFPKPKERVIF